MFALPELRGVAKRGQIGGLRFVDDVCFIFFVGVFLHIKDLVVSV